ncbi:MAG: class I SAM-dependent methyltransferase, partial [Bacteroidota bacterium]
MIQKLISFLPFRERINFFFQKYVTKGVHLDDQHFLYKLDAARDHIRFYRAHGTVPPAEALVLELGTGWYPIVPTALFLAGFKATVSIDISNWMKLERQLIAITKILDYYDRGLLVDYIPEIQPGRLATLRELVENRNQLTVTKLNQVINLDYRIMDATKLDFADDTFDFICSNNTFEHIYVDVLREILREFKRTVKTTGVMSHFIDLSDHFAHMDGTINIYNFLRYGDK